MPSAIAAITMKAPMSGSASSSTPTTPSAIAIGATARKKFSLHVHLAHHVAGGVHRDRQLGQLARLEVHDAQRDPAARAVDALADVRHQHHAPAAPATRRRATAPTSPRRDRHLQRRPSAATKAIASESSMARRGSASARSARTAGCRAARPRPNRPSPGRARAGATTHPDQRLVEAEQPRRLAATSADPVAHRHRVAGSPGARRSAGAAASARSRDAGRAPCVTPAPPRARPRAPAPRRRRPRRGARSCGTCPGWRRPGSSSTRVAGARLREAPVDRGLERRVALQRHAGGGERGLDRRRIAADQRHRARMARHRRGRAARSPAPCRRRRGSRPAWPAPCRRPGRRARRPWRRRWCPCCRRRPRRRRRCATNSTRCGSPRYSRRPCSIGASGQPMAVASASAASALAALWRPRMRSASAGIRRCRCSSSASACAAL